MSDPCKREYLRVGTRNDELRGDPNKHTGIGVRAARVSPSFDQRPLEEIQETMELGGGPWIPESAFWQMMRGKPRDG